MPFNATRWWHQPLTQPFGGTAPRVLIVTDIDGLLSEHGTAGWEHDHSAIDFLAACGIPLVINSSRTRSEVERVQRRLRAVGPFITEHGSALFFPRGSLPAPPGPARPIVGGSVIEFGKCYHDVVDTLRVTCAELGIEVIGLAELSIEEVAGELGTTIAQAQLIKLREYTELFRIIGETEAVRSRLLRVLRRRGLRTCRVGRHHLVTAAIDRMESLRTLIDLWRGFWGDPVIVGIGDSEDDEIWLRHLDAAVVVRHADRDVATPILGRLPTARVTQKTGLSGWNEAVFTVEELLARPGFRALRRDELGAGA